MAGVPFREIEEISTCKTSAVAHGLLKERDWLEKPQASGFFSFRPHQGEAELNTILNQELDIARGALWKSIQDVLPRYLVFGAKNIRNVVLDLLLDSVGKGKELPVRKKRERARERHLLLYLQRLCTKNDTLSEFGPGGWGMVSDRIVGLELRPRPGIATRESFLERWTAHGAAAALNADPEVRAELAPRLLPGGRLDGHTFTFTATGEKRHLEPQMIEALHRCDGKTPAHSLGVDLHLLERAALQDMIVWEVEVPALEPHAFDVLILDILRWRATPVRNRWLDLLQPITDLARQFAAAKETASRIEIIDEARERLEHLGAARKTSDRFLYSAINPIGEECFRDCGFSISEALMEEVAVDAAPWIDLWRDTYAFVASRVASGLRQLFEQAPLQDGALPLPAFMRHCAAQKMPLTGPAMVGLAHVAFQEVKAAFRERFGRLSDAKEYELSRADCHFVREEFQYEKFDEYTFPSADLQIAAKSVEGVARGEYRWILAELHPPAALLHHGFYWSCHDTAELSRALSATVFGRPSFHFGFSAADFTATTVVRLFDALPGHTNFVASERGNPKWRTIAPAETEVYVDDQNGDVCLRLRSTREHLGSFARAWVIPLGFHPFSFSLGYNTPRLCCGSVIVQRRCWTVTLSELGKGDFTGISRDLVLAMERLRINRELPRYVYIRPTEQALRRTGAEGRDKDTKPVFIDLESYLFLEIFHRWLTKSGEVEVVEMLPDPDHLFWKEGDERYTFELRTLIVPRE